MQKVLLIHNFIQHQEQELEEEVCICYTQLTNIPQLLSQIFGKMDGEESHRNLLLSQFILLGLFQAILKSNVCNHQLNLIDRQY